MIALIFKVIKSFFFAFATNDVFLPPSMEYNKYFSSLKSFVSPLSLKNGENTMVQTVLPRC